MVPAPTPERFGPYRVEALLGEGGMGRVYRVRHEGDGTVHALKVVRSEWLAHGDVARRFAREVRLMAGIAHPSLVRVREAALDEDPPWFVMEHLEGRDLATLVEADGPLDPSEAATMAGRIAGALGELHRATVIHRDVKPENVMVVDGGRRHVLMDLGLARAADSSRLTRTGRAVGTPRFMSPEMRLGRVVGPSSDVYQLGLCLHVALTGSLPGPMAGELDGLLEHLRRGDRISVRELRPELDRGMDTLVANALVVDETLRTPDMKSFLDELARWRTGEPIPPRGAEGAGEADTAELTLDPDDSGRSPRVASRAMARGVASDETGAMATEREERRRAKVAGVLALALLGLFGLGRLLGPGEPPPTIRNFEIRQGVGSLVASWESSRPTASRLELILPGGGPPRVIEGAGGRRVLRHRVELPVSEGVEKVSLRVLLPGGERSMERVAAVQHRFELGGFRMLHGAAWPPELRWATNLPMRASLRYRVNGRPVELDLPGGLRRDHGWRARDWPPLSGLDDFVIVSVDAAGRSFAAEPRRLPDLPSAFADAVERHGREKLREAFAEAFRRGRSAGEEHNLRRQIDGVLAGLEGGALLAPLLELGKAYLGDLSVPLAERRRVYRCLGEFLLADQRFIAMGRSPRFGVAAVMDGFATAEDGGGRTDYPGVSLIRVALEPYRDYLFPANLGEAQRRKTFEALRRLWPMEELPLREVRGRFELSPEQRKGLRRVHVILDVHQFYPHYWIEVSLNGALSAMICNRRIEDPDDMLHLGVSGRDLGHQAAGRQFVLHLEGGHLREGANEFVLVLRTLGPLGTLLTALRSWEIRLEPGAP